jgi:serine phosphatase RsbU (regulator of sigma subunit)
MARRSGVLASIAPPASLALALSILIAFAVALPSASAHKAAGTSGPAEGSSAAGGTAEAAIERPGATRKAERLARRNEREAAAGGPAVKGEEAAPAAAGTGKAHGGTAAGSHAARRAERAAERAARKSGSAAPAAKSVPHGATPATSKAKGPGEHEREERRRAHEEQRHKSGRESYKEKQARLAREKRESQAGGQGAGAPEAGAGLAATASSIGLAPAASPEERATGASAPTTPGKRAVQAAKSSRTPVRAHHRRTARSTGALGGAALPAAGVTAAIPAPRASAPQAKRATRPARTPRSSPLVTTVTRIIGVIPTALWLLIGILAIAALAFATSSRLAARRARRLDRQRRELLEDVGLLQAALLPNLPGRLGAVSTTAAYRPASGPAAGGDFYDVFGLPEGLVAVIVGDVSGHGRDALPHTTLLRYTLRAYLEAGLTPREALHSAAPALERQLGGSFATVVLATYDPRERLLTYAAAGHPHPMLTGLGPDAQIIAASAPPIGAGRPTGTRQTVVSVPGGALAAFYTDGVIEARTDGELYGQRRLSDVLEELDAAGEVPTASSLLDRVREQTDRRPDDMAACLLGISGGEERPEIVSEEIVLDGREAGQARARRFLLAAGVPESEVDGALRSARAVAADHGSALLKIHMGQGTPRLTLTHDNVAPLRARALARTQEVAL